MAHAAQRGQKPHGGTRVAGVEIGFYGQQKSAAAADGQLGGFGAALDCDADRAQPGDHAHRIFAR